MRTTEMRIDGERMAFAKIHSVGTGHGAQKRHAYARNKRAVATGKQGGRSRNIGYIPRCALQRRPPPEATGAPPYEGQGELNGVFLVA